MSELSPIGGYEIISPDGTRIVLGNSDDAKADPDYCGWLDPDSGLEDLLDGAEHRESPSDLVEADGATQGPTWLGRRSGTLKGSLHPEITDVYGKTAIEQKVKRATRALQQDGTMRWTPRLDGIRRELAIRRPQRCKFGGRRPDTYLIALTSTWPYVLSATEHNLVISPGASSSEAGIPDPFPDPITSEVSPAGQGSIVNAGDGLAWPRLRIDGPATNPEILNNTTSRTIRIIYDLAAGDYISIAPEFGTILLNGSADLYGNLDFDATEWWQLQGGANDVRFLNTAYAAPAAVTVYWKDAFE